jgi:peptidoglycan/LPS O-acetylase OafA/YrhL
MLVTRRGPERVGPVPRLDFLDGLRGLAALYVVLHHAAMLVPPAGLAGTALAVRFLLRHGHAAVAVFVVLSGYCLMLPVARDPEGRLPGGLLAFLGRRARRILPPYYVALGLCLLLIVLAPAKGQQAHVLGHSGTVVSHLLLAHNLDPRWIFRIAPPFWSVATECQIYVLFPGLLVLWRRWGISAAVAGGFALGYAVATLALPLGNPALRQLCPWYVGLFALGMAGAVTTESQRASAGEGRASPGRAGIGIGVVALVFAGSALAGNTDRAFMISDPLVGAATACLIVRGTLRSTLEVATPKRPVFRFLERRWAVALGIISYSLYLVHYPLLVLASSALRTRGWAPGSRLAVLLLVAAPLCLPVAVLFHALFERGSSWRLRDAFRRMTSPSGSPNGPRRRLS